MVTKAIAINFNSQLLDMFPITGKCSKSVDMFLGAKLRTGSGRWTCKECGGPVCVQTGICRDCGRKYVCASRGEKAQ